MAATDDARWALGVFFIVMVAALWAGSSVLTQFIYDNLHFDEPFVLTYLGTSLFAIYLPSWWLLSYLGWVDNPPLRFAPDVSEPLDECFDARKYEKISLVNANTGEANDVFGEDGDLSDTDLNDNTFRKHRTDFESRAEVFSPIQAVQNSPFPPSQQQPREVGGVANISSDLMSPILGFGGMSTGQDAETATAAAAEAAAGPILRSGSDDARIIHAAGEERGQRNHSGGEEGGAGNAQTSAAAAAADGKGVGVMSHTGTARVSLLVCPIWFLANWSYNQSLSMTSITSSTIISTTSALFSFILSVCFAGEKFTLLKLAGVGCCMGGTVLVTLSDSLGGGSGGGDDGGNDDGGGNGDNGGGGEDVETTHQTLGDLVALFSAVCYSCYTVGIKSFLPDDDAVAMPLLFGYLGLFNMLLLAPVLLLVVVLGKGAAVQGLTPTVFGLICAGGFFNNVVSDYLWARAVVLTTPTIATVGLSLTIPLAFLSDAFFHGLLPEPLEAFGAGCVVAGFVLVNAGDDGGDGGSSCESKANFLLAKAKGLARQCPSFLGGRG
mmetsp:Transcript_8367/g.16064  ORF Transcript_8367/g.16064 Transcript_8367/m.16064 type:complete len:551 (+) Transcript_8367:99-1751(+)